MYVYNNIKCACQSVLSIINGRLVKAHQERSLGDKRYCDQFSSVVSSVHHLSAINEILPKTAGSRTLIFGLKHRLLNFHQVCSKVSRGCAVVLGFARNILNQTSNAKRVWSNFCMNSWLRQVWLVCMLLRLYNKSLGCANFSPKSISHRARI